MLLTPDKVASIIDLIRDWYPGWESVEDSKFQKGEVIYKREAMEKAQDLIGRQQLDELLRHEDYPEFIARLDKTAHLANFLFLSAPSTGDLRVMYQEGLDQREFCLAVYDLMYGSSTSEDRFQRYVDHVVELDLPNYWTFPTYFLYFCHPDLEIFIKPRVTQHFLRFIDAPVRWKSRPTGDLYKGIRQVALEVLNAFRPYGARDMVDAQSIIWTAAQVDMERLATNEKRAEFQQIFGKFLIEYPQTPDGRKHIAGYDHGRQVARENYAEICAAADRGEEITDAVLLKMLPYVDSQRNREAGAWVHLAPTINGDIRKWYERAGWTRPEDWPKIALAILNFVRRCVDTPEELKQACLDFSALPHSKDFQAGTLTPILNALRPDEFALINSKSCVTLNFFADKKYAQSLEEYPVANETMQRLIKELGAILDEGADLALSLGDLFDMFAHWLVAVHKYNFRNSRYWKIAAGEESWQWNECVDGGFIAIGWDELGDLSKAGRTEFGVVVDKLNKQFGWTKQALEQVWKFAKHIREGDWIVTNFGTTELLGVGTVVGPYYFVPDVRHGHRLPVEWTDTTRRQINEGGWRKTLIKIARGKFEMLVNAPRIEQTPALAYNPPSSAPPIIRDQYVHPDCPFSLATFELLAALEADPTKTIYEANRDAFKQEVEEPFKRVMRSVAQLLPKSVLEKMETGRYNFGRFLKNDFGQGGAWPFYWGAFYPKGSKRARDAQLSAWVNYECMEYGFYIGEYGSAQRERFQRNCQRHQLILEQQLQAVLATGDIVFGDRSTFRVEQDGTVVSQFEGDSTWKAFLADPSNFNCDVSVVVPRSQLLQLSEDELVDRMARTHAKLFPLVLLATESDPLQAIADYLELDEVEEPKHAKNEEYPLSSCATDTGFSEDHLNSWASAIRRKKQAILYGPPGTGKTYIAEKLARHLTGGGDGFVELVQFHPAYAYEDFIEGIRPQPKAGLLEYPVLPGRFLQFCEETRKRNGDCVLIVDEINRANLARVFGELMYLLEYRNQNVRLAVSGQPFSIPENVYLIGTMNTADRSIALVDHALRRRFAFLPLYPDYDVLRLYYARRETQVDIERIIELLMHVNRQINDRHYHLGITFFIDEDIDLNLENIWRMEIEPYLEEYFFD